MDVIETNLADNTTENPHIQPAIDEASMMLANEIVSSIPSIAEENSLPVENIAIAVWTALFCDLIGDNDIDGIVATKLFDAARTEALKSQQNQSCELSH